MVKQSPGASFYKVIIILVVLLGAAGVGAWYFFGRPSATDLVGQSD